MSDTIACSNCGTDVPSAAAFCTGCGQPLRGEPSGPPPLPGPDATRIETPGLNDATQVTPPPPAAEPASPFAAPAAPPPPASAPSGPWGPSTSEAAEPPAAAPSEPPTSAPWGAPAPSAPAAPGAPPAWGQQPAGPPPGAATFTTAPPPPSAPAWGQPGAPGAPPAWGQQPAAPAPATGTRGGSILGGLVGLMGSVLAIVGVFSGWVKLGSTGTVTAWSLTAGEGLIKTSTPYAIVAVSVFALLFSVLLATGIARTPVRIVTALLGVAIIGITAANWAEIASFVTDNFPSSFEATTAIGFYLTIAGGVLVIVAALLPGKKK